MDFGTYTYGMMARGPVPKGFVEFVRTASYPLGTVTYDKPLTPTEIENFRLEPIKPSLSLYEKAITGIDQRATQQLIRGLKASNA